MAPDAIDAAIAEAAKVQMVQFQLQLPTSGRPCVIAVPQDLTEREALGLHSVVNQVYDQLYTARQSAPQIVVPTPRLVVPR